MLLDEGVPLEQGRQIGVLLLKKTLFCHYWLL